MNKAEGIQYRVAIVVEQEVREGDPNGNCCWVKSNDESKNSWSLLAERDTVRDAEDLVLTIFKMMERNVIL